MIYTLEKPYNQGLYVGWTEFLKSTNIPYETLVDNTLEQDVEFESFMSFQHNIDFINEKVKKENTLIIDSSYFRREDGSWLNFPQINEWCKKLNSDNIIVMHPDTGYSPDEAHNENGVKVLTPTYKLEEWDDNKLQSNYNFYICNGAYQSLKWLASIIFERYKEMLRAKKFLSYNGVYKIHRTLIQKTLEDNDLMKDTFFSYNAYNILDENCNQNYEFDVDYNNFTEALYGHNSKYNHVNDFREKEVLPYYSKEEHEKLLKKLPVVLDYIPNLSNVDQYAFTLPYTSNAYVEIIGCTSLTGNGNEIYTSEKIFKPFMSYLIPIFIGQRGLLTLLKKLGFELEFDGLVDISYDSIECNLERTKQALENVKRIGKFSIAELHNNYHRHREKLIHNNKLMKELYTKQVDSFKQII